MTDALTDVEVTATWEPPSDVVTVRAKHLPTGVQVKRVGDPYEKTRDLAIDELREAVRLWYANAC